MTKITFEAFRICSHALLVAVIFFTCKSENEPTREGYIPDQIQPYADTFIAEAKKRGVTVSLDNLIVEFEEGIELNGQQNLTGLCRNSTSLNTPVIILDTTLGWWQSGELAREEVIFHELGHCILGRPHEDRLLENDNYASIMRTSSPLLYAKLPGTVSSVFKVHRREYYLDELFLKTDTEPCWAQTTPTANLNIISEFESQQSPNVKMLQEASGTMWISSSWQLSYSIDGSAPTVIDATSGFETDYNTRIGLDHNGELWALNTDYRLPYNTIWKHDGNLHFDEIYRSDSMPLTNDQIRAFAFTSEGDFWYSTWASDLVFQSANTSSNLIFNSENSNLPDALISHILPMQDGRTIFGTANQLLVDTGNYNFELLDQGESQMGLIVEMVGDTRGNIWVSDQLHLARINSENQFSSSRLLPYGLNYMRINDLFVDRSNQLWIGSSTGLRRWTDGSLSAYCDFSLGESKNVIEAFFIDQQKRFWLQSGTLIIAQPN
ncbi:MAG: hypothetical protein KI790_10185 [Cyclobacteriaceae bacterium]|nr:hypothetical protein [Cyclobacteriaceae bacterium HetDA_MAG_MS6]